jgi:hypothetical protein
MTISIVEMNIPNAERVTVTDDILTVELSDGRALSAPLAWLPRLVRGTAAERTKAWGRSGHSDHATGSRFAVRLLRW